MIKFLMFLSSFFIFSTSVSSNSFGWGFSKNKNHTQPYIGSYEKEIQGTNSYYVGDDDEKVVYLTFDAGYDNGNLIKILDCLDEKDVQATFFVTGDFVNRFSDLTIEINNRGHLVGNHTYSHKNITSLNKKEIEKEIRMLENDYYEVTKDSLDPFFRPPAGVFNKESLSAVSELGYNTVFWSVAYKDWEVNNQNGIEYSVKSVIDNLHNGAIILLHTVSSDNALALPLIIDKIREEGYEIRSLNNLINDFVY